MNTHTPGPWTCGQGAFGKDYAVYSTDDDGHNLAMVCRVSPAYGEYAATRCQANAHLIAAAPDLLYALQGLVAWVEQHHPEAAQNLTLTRLAIARATGEQK